MTDEQLKALDRLCWERIMGWKTGAMGDTCHDGKCWRTFRPTRDLNHCGEMDAVMMARGWSLEIQRFAPPRTNPTEPVCRVMYRAGGRGPGRPAHASRLSIAWTLAALKAVLGSDYTRVLKEAGVEV